MRKKSIIIRHVQSQIAWNLTHLHEAMHDSCSLGKNLLRFDEALEKKEQLVFAFPVFIGNISVLHCVILK